MMTDADRDRLADDHYDDSKREDDQRASSNPLEFLIPTAPDRIQRTRGNMSSGIAEARIDAQGRVLCNARRHDREPCNSPAIKGLSVCRMHGGSTSAARRRARLRLTELVDPAIATLAREMAQADKSTDRQNAANSILDRAGWGRSTKIEAQDARALLVQRLIELHEDSQYSQELAGGSQGGRGRQVITSSMLEEEGP